MQPENPGMNVCMLVKEFPPDVIGGTETQSLRMAEMLGQSGCHVTVYTKDYTDSSSDYAHFEMVRVPNWNLNPFVSTLTYLIMAIFLLLRDRSQYDVLHCMTVYPNGFVGYILQKITGLQYFAWVRGGDFYLMKAVSWKRWMMERVFRDTLVLVQSESISRDVKAEFPESNLEILGNGVSMPEERASGDSIVYVGRLKKQKGLEFLIRGVSKLDEDLLIVGDGPERHKLEGICRDVGTNATFVGWVEPDSVGEYLKRGKMFCLPSIEGEGLPNTILEAYSYGLPVIATDIAGVPDVVTSGETGFVVESGSEAALAEKVKLLCNDEDYRESLSVGARKYVEDAHDWQALLDELTDVYERISESE